MYEAKGRAVDDELWINGMFFQLQCVFSRERLRTKRTIKHFSRMLGAFTMALQGIGAEQVVCLRLPIVGTEAAGLYPST